ncbi:hypothetical protein [Conservatibacter flavescens]|uniref:Lipoprotein n=1 Tax=Conservatibacter flavescens TaxID=28161 RepID=A0A2M8S0B9_9PAST|nr:hypothetical protein [Conservatibacter flavescens]PJG84587.1 hypothetical protein CVP05_10640 [Conservatibacter flavescens]
MITKPLIYVTLLLSGCYLANGSPSSVNFWIKNNKKISFKEIVSCEKGAYASLGKRSLQLYNKFRNGDHLNNEENKELNKYDMQATFLVRQCYYDLGYRFNAPIHWCLAQDGDNSRICVENMKYRK